MSLTARMLIVLTAVGLLSGGFLSTVGILTRDRIALNKQKEIEEAITLVVPGTEVSRSVYQEKDFTVYEGKAADGRVAGYAIYSTGVGFQDKIALMIGTDAALSRIFRLTILDQKETPGLGAKITSQGSFLVFWEDRDCSRPLELRKPPAPDASGLSSSEVNTITGATISSEAVITIVNGGVERARSLKAGGKFGGGE